MRQVARYMRAAGWGQAWPSTLFAVRKQRNCRIVFNRIGNYIVAVPRHFRRCPSEDSKLSAMNDFSLARHNMVESQVRPNKVTDNAVLLALGAVPREAFVPVDLRGVAYVDEDIAIAPGRFLMEPMVFARLLQIAEVRPTDMVLDIGCGTGYSTAVLARLCDTVVGLEVEPELATQASETLTELGVDNAAVIEGALDQGYPKQAPYDVILFNGAVDDVPERISQQLAEGGRLVAVQRGASGPGRAKLLSTVGGVLSGRTVFDAATPRLPGFEPDEGFAF